jgi:hypothetical protein
MKRITSKPSRNLPAALAQLARVRGGDGDSSAVPDSEAGYAGDTHGTWRGQHVGGTWGT